MSHRQCGWWCTTCSVESWRRSPTDPSERGRTNGPLDGRGLPAGVYVVRVVGDGLVLTHRVTLLR